VYDIRKVQSDQQGLKLNGALEILFCGKDAGLLGVKKHTFCEG